MLAGLLVVAGCRDHTQRDADDYQKGVDAYAKGDYAIALGEFKPLAERSNAQAQFSLGMMYHQGRGVPQDDKEAAAWWGKAAEQGHAEAQDNLGFRYARGQGVPQDWVQADKWFTIASVSGNESAMKNKKVIEVHMPAEKIAEANKLAQEWREQHQKLPGLVEATAAHPSSSP